MLDRNTNRAQLFALCWLVVALEALSPVPLFLTLGAAWILLTRPPWFLRIVREIYGVADDGRE